jgi:hypothetical protein
MVRPTKAQQDRARARIRALIEMRPDGGTRPGELPKYVFSHKRGIIAGTVVLTDLEGTPFEQRDIYSEVQRYDLGYASTFGFPLRQRGVGQSRDRAKLRIGRLLGYKGSERNIIRSVNRLTMKDRSSKQARNLRSTDQIRSVDRSFNYYKKKEGVGIIDENLRLDITRALLPAVTLPEFRDNQDPEERVMGGGSVFNDNRRFEPNDVVEIFNRRMGILLSQTDISSTALRVVFQDSELGFVRQEVARRLRPLVTYARDIIPDNENIRTVVVN